MRLRLFLIVTVLVAAGLAATAMPGSDAPVPAARSTALRDGTAGGYDMILTGGWHYDGLPEGAAVDGLRFELAGMDTVPDRDGRQVHAMRVLWEGPVTTLLPPAGVPSWSQEREVHWSDGQRIATQRGGGDSLAFDYPATPMADCLLGGVQAGPLPWDCQIPGLRISLPAGTMVRDLGIEDHGRVQWQHLQATGPVVMDWWFARDVPVPMRVEATAPGAPGLEPRTVRLDLTALLPGQGDAAPPASAIAGSQLRWAPRQVWGPDDRNLDHPFPLAEAFTAARNSVHWPELRQWMAAHPGAYVFMADYQEHERDGLHCSWRIHLSDGKEGFSLRATKTHQPVPLLGPETDFKTLATHELATAAPSPDQAPALMPRIDALWERWRDHAGPAGREAANLWGFRLLADADGEPVAQYAVGMGRSLQWELAGLDVAVLGGGGSQSSLLVLDGDGRALRYEESGMGATRAPAASPPYVPASLPYIEPHWPWMPATSASLVAVAFLALLPKALAALFTRFQPHQLLDHPMRASVMEAVRAEPGIHFRALCNRLDRNPGQVRHHVRKLVDGRLVVARTAPGYTCYFPYSGTPRALLEAGPLIRSDGARNLMGALTAWPGASSKDLALAAGLSPATATYHLKRLQQAGLVAARRDGKAMRMHLTPDGQQAAATVV